MATHPAQALTIYPQTGTAKNYVRTDEHEQTVWREAKTTFGSGPPHEPWPESPKLTPAELAELVAAALE